MRVLVTGAAGQVGRLLLETRPGDVEVIAAARSDLDIRDATAVRERMLRDRPDVIINAAAYTAVDQAESDPQAARAINAEAPAVLATAARQVAARLIHLSTDFVFDGRASTPYVPDAPTNPLNVYGRTKRDGEEAVLRGLGSDAVILRTAWVYCAHAGNFMHTMLRLLRTRGEVGVVADQVGTPTSARSVAQVLWQIARRGEIQGIHHWTDAGVASWYDFAMAIAEEAVALGMLPSTVTVTPIATEEYPTAARRPAYSVLDKRALSAYGLIPRHWRQCLREVLKELPHG